MDIPGYQIAHELGRGGMATVYLARQLNFERDVALKVMASALALDKTFSERFLREARIMAQLSHPNIVAVYDVGEVNENHYIAMEFHDGGDLKQKIGRGLSVLEAINITIDVANALDYAHSKGFIHRDIKPDNVLFSSNTEGRAILTDFGIAKAADSQTQLTQMGTVAGTPKYMSPEQARGQDLAASSDLYSLGIMFYQMLSGRLPFKANDSIALAIKHLKEPLPSLPKELKVFDKVLQKMCAKEAGQRFQSGKEIAQTLEKLKLSLQQKKWAKEQGETSFRQLLSDDDIAQQEPAGNDKGQAGKSDAAKKPVKKAAAKKVKKKRSSSIAFVGVLALVLMVGLYLQSNQQVIMAWLEPAPLNPSESLLRAAEIDFNQARYISPRDNSAWYKYAEVLAIEPNNAIAKAGQKRVIQKVLQLAVEAKQRGDSAKALNLVHKAETLMPDNDYVQEAMNKIMRNDISVKAEAEPVKQISSTPAEDEFNADTLVGLKVSGLLRGAQSDLEKQNIQAAKAKYQQVLQLDPYNKNALNALSSIR